MCNTPTGDGRQISQSLLRRISQVQGGSSSTFYLIGTLIVSLNPKIPNTILSLSFNPVRYIISSQHFKELA